MKSIDEARLETDVAYRFGYLAEFIGFTGDDAALIQASAPHLGPAIPHLVDSTYARLLSYDATARHFVPRQHGFAGPLPRSAEELTQASPPIRFRKDHLTRYFMQLIGRSYDDKMVSYLDMVGKIHTPQAGNREIQIPLVQMNALMGLLSDILIGALAEMPVDAVVRVRTIRAFQKLMWIQNDFINRHYLDSATLALPPSGHAPAEQ